MQRIRLAEALNRSLAAARARCCHRPEEMLLPMLRRAVIILFVVAGAVVFYTLLQFARDTFSPYESYANSLGLTLSQCVEAQGSSGMSDIEAHDYCDRRVAKRQ